MKKVKNYQKPAANDDFFRSPEPVKSRAVPPAQQKPVLPKPTNKLPRKSS